MLLKALVDEDFVNYKITSMFIGCHSCTFKCDIMSGKQVCQNGALANQPDIDISIDNIVDRYLKNPLSKAIVFGGLEPFDDILNVLSVIETLRHKGNNDDVGKEDNCSPGRSTHEGITKDILACTVAH